MSKKILISILFLFLGIVVIGKMDKQPEGIVISEKKGVSRANQRNPHKVMISRAEYKDFQRYLEFKDKDILMTRRVKLFAMPEADKVLDITDRVLADKYYEQYPNIKEQVIASGRRFYIFKYPSDDLEIIGYISFIPSRKNSKTVFIIRGGNRSFGVPFPGHERYIYGDAVYVGTTLRGGLNPGRDEFGGKDVNDVINLARFLPTLSTKIEGILISSKWYMVGESRGAMQMILALARSSWLQNKIQKIVSIVGLLDLQETLKNRPDMERMFYKDFQLTPYNQAAWIKLRNPLEAINNIRKDLPILIIQGTDDIRVDLSEGRRMTEKLQSLGNKVEYWEIEDKGHSLNVFDDKLDAWLEML